MTTLNTYDRQCTYCNKSITIYISGGECAYAQMFGSKFCGSICFRKYEFMKTAQEFTKTIGNQMCDSDTKKWIESMLDYTIPEKE